MGHASCIFDVYGVVRLCVCVSFFVGESAACFLPGRGPVFDYVHKINHVFFIQTPTLRVSSACSVWGLVLGSCVSDRLIANGVLLQPASGGEFTKWHILETKL